MTKRVKPRSRTSQKQERKTNWLLMGGIIGVGVITLFALLALSLQGPGAPTPVPTPGPSLVLQNYCEQNPDNCMADGSADAPVTIVEISDYGCGHCKNFNLSTGQILKTQYVDSGQVRWFTVPYALSGQFGDLPTAPSANAAMCAAEQGAFEPYHLALFENQGTNAFNTEAGFMSAAAALNLDTEAFQSCLDDGRYNDIILQNVREANNAGVNSTPSFFINGQLIRGNAPIENFQQVIEAELRS
ncbi:MAG: DsbA family protein [Chloroflexota bacterium]